MDPHACSFKYSENDAVGQKHTCFVYFAVAVSFFTSSIKTDMNIIWNLDYIPTVGLFILINFYYEIPQMI